MAFRKSTPEPTRPPPASAPAPAAVRRGDLYLVGLPAAAADPQALTRLFLVTEVTGKVCEGMLVDANTDLATDLDARLSFADTGFAYPVAVHTHLHGPIWNHQLRRHVGQVTPATLDQLLTLAGTDTPDDVTLTRGTPLQGTDPRRADLLALQTDLDLLTASCRARPTPKPARSPRKPRTPTERVPHRGTRDTTGVPARAAAVARARTRAGREKAPRAHRVLAITATTVGGLAALLALVPVAPGFTRAIGTSNYDMLAIIVVVALIECLPLVLALLALLGSRSLDATWRAGDHDGARGMVADVENFAWMALVLGLPVAGFALARLLGA